MNAQHGKTIRRNRENHCMSVSQASSKPVLLAVNPVANTRATSETWSSSAISESSTNKGATSNSIENVKSNKNDHDIVSATAGKNTIADTNNPDEKNNQKENVVTVRDRLFKDYLNDSGLQEKANIALKTSSFFEKEVSVVKGAGPTGTDLFSFENIDNRFYESRDSYSLTDSLVKGHEKDNKITSTIKNISEKIKNLTSIVQGREASASEIKELENNQLEKNLANDLDHDNSFLAANVDNPLEIKTAGSVSITKDIETTRLSNGANNGNQGGKELPSSAAVIAVTDMPNGNSETLPVVETVSLEASALAFGDYHKEQKGQNVNALTNSVVSSDDNVSQNQLSEVESPEQKTGLTNAEKPAQTDLVLENTTQSLVVGNETASRQTEYGLRQADNVVSDDKPHQFKNNFFSNREVNHSQLIENNGRDNDIRLPDLKDSGSKLQDLVAEKMLSNKEGSTQTQQTPTSHSVSEQAIKHSGSQVLQQDIQRAVMQKNPLASPLPNILANSQWQNGVGEKVLWMAAQNIQSAEVQLDPPELGQLHIKITIGQESASVNFISPHASVREALDASAFRLREMFQQEGLDLVDVGVSDQSSRQSFTDNEGDGDNGSQDNGGHGLNGSDNQVPSNEMMMTQKIGLNNMVDFYV